MLYGLDKPEIIEGEEGSVDQEEELDQDYSSIEVTPEMSVKEVPPIIGRVLCFRHFCLHEGAPVHGRCETGRSK